VRYVDNVQAYLNILAVAGIGSPPAEESPEPGDSQGPEDMPRPERRASRD
jgi:hypothetical protein